MYSPDRWKFSAFNDAAVDLRLISQAPAKGQVKQFLVERVAIKMARLDAFGFHYRAAVQTALGF